MPGNANLLGDAFVLKKHGAFRREKLHGLAVPDHTVPYGTVLSGRAHFQALRAWLLSCCPSGTKR
jgi:hypothetical protein